MKALTSDLISRTIGSWIAENGGVVTYGGYPADATGIYTVYNTPRPRRRPYNLAELREKMSPRQAHDSGRNFAWFGLLFSGWTSG